MIQTENREILALVEYVSALASKVLGDRLAAVYVMGSLARGGFSEAVSDIDIALVLQGPGEPADEKTIASISGQSCGKYPAVSNELALFWGTVDGINGADGGSAPSPFDRRDLIDHAVLIGGVDIRPQLQRPSGRDLEVEGVERLLAMFAEQEGAEVFRNPPLLLGRGKEYVSKVVLFPVRYLYIASTGETAGHDVTSRYYAQNFPGEGVALVRMAYSLRDDAHTDIATGSSAELPDLLERQLAPLYGRFVDLYRSRMKSYGEQALAERLDTLAQTLGLPA